MVKYTLMKYKTYYDGKRSGMSRNYFFSDIIVSAIILLIGTAEAAHLYGVFLHRPLTECIVIFSVLAVLALCALTALSLWVMRKQGRKNTEKDWSAAEKIMVVIFAFLVLTQLLYIIAGRGIYRRGDIIMEAVTAFLQNDGIYKVNPLTGNAYEAGLPIRIEILCLPTLYASLSRILRLEPRTLVWSVVPAAALICCYAAYDCVGRALFPEQRNKRVCFLIAVAVLLWVGSYRFGMDGFGVLFAGWQGVTLRNAVLIPYALSLCLRDKYIHAVLCVLAEACIVWTLYGMGACAPIIGGMALISFILRKTRRGEAA